MFLIAKIVRGRRLLHQLEQEVEKEKAQKEREKMLAKASGGTTPAGRASSQQTRQNSQALDEPSCSDPQSAEVGAAEVGVSGERGIELKELIGGKELVIGEAEGIQREEESAEKGVPSQWRTYQWAEQHQIVYRSAEGMQRRQRAVRQRTDSSLPSADEELLSTRSIDNSQMRRTSSMPSVVESDAHQRITFPATRRGGMVKPVKYYNYEDRLSKLHKRALRFTWQRLQTRNGGKRIETVFDEVFDRMMRSLPVMREMFNTRTFISAMSRCEMASAKDHARLIVKMFDAAIKNLEVEERKRTDSAGEFDPTLLGKAHAALRPYGFTSALWEAFGEAVIDVVLNQEAVRDLPGASQAWVVLTACLIDQLRAGFDSSRESRECPFQRTQQLNGSGVGQAQGQQGQRRPQRLCRMMSTKVNRTAEEGEGRERAFLTPNSAEENMINYERRNTIASTGQCSGDSQYSEEDEQLLEEMMMMRRKRNGRMEGMMRKEGMTVMLPHPPQRALSTKRRGFSAMPERRVSSTAEMKILQDMTSTEL